MLMTRKTKDLYMESFNKQRSLVPDFAPVNIMADFVTLRFKHELNKLCELHCTCIFRTCIFHRCRFVLAFSVLVFSSTCVFSAPVCACWAYMYDVLRKRKNGSQAGLGLYGGRLVMAQNYSTH